MSGTQTENPDPEDQDRREVDQGSPDSADVHDGLTPGSGDEEQNQSNLRKFMEWWTSASVEEQHMYMKKVEQMLKLRETGRKVEHLYQKKKQRDKEEFEQTAIGRLMKRHREKGKRNKKSR